MLPARRCGGSIPRHRGPRRRQGQEAQIWLHPLTALLLLVVAAAIGYRLAEPRYGWGDAFWMVLVTLTTVGYGEVHPLGPGGRIVTTLLLLGGIAVVQLLIQRFIQLSNSGYFRRLRRRSDQIMIDRFCDHVILCGYGRMGQEIAARIGEGDVPLVVVDSDPKRNALAADHGLFGICGDASLDEVLLKAGIERARSLVAVLGSNADNLYVVLSARAIAAHVRVIVRTDSQEAASKLRRAGADEVVSPYVAGGRTIANKALHPEAASFMELLAGTEYRIESIQLSHSQAAFDKLPGQTLADLNLGFRSGVLVLAIRSAQGVQANPGGQATLSPGDQLILLGSQRQRQAAERVLGLAAESIEVLLDPAVEPQKEDHDATRAAGLR
ncbi:MAG: potassium channel protein [Aphanocapsa feldmannii 277cV]|uniref:Potassium channel protein n=2 Tax=Aphanocapsa feldmannii TaxID=192050 RepID=A0A524RQC4_9CHRO|nr:MAG: potassium channel protein [Aphanocapsa feldmannii 277cV]TGH21040.1 MAG: potassium channel protein [Aphanocapsa feldmannii 277cI]